MTNVALTLFPSRAAIGRVRVADVELPVMMTTEFERALAALFLRVGGTNGPSIPDIEDSSAVESLGPVFDAIAQQLAADVAAQQLVQAQQLVGEMGKAMEDLRAQIEVANAALFELQKRTEDAFALSGFTDPFRVNWERPGSIGSLTPAPGSFTGLNTTSTAFIGNGSANTRCRVNGTNSGVNGGATVETQNNGTTIIAIGNKSVLLGGAYDASPYIFCNAEPEFSHVPRVPGGGYLLRTMSGLNNGAAAAAATLTNAPTAGNPSKWIPLNDNGTIRYIPCW